jgi:hypothetical protein
MSGYGLQLGAASCSEFCVRIWCRCSHACAAQGPQRTVNPSPVAEPCLVSQSLPSLPRGAHRCDRRTRHRAPLLVSHPLSPGLLFAFFFFLALFFLVSLGTVLMMGQRKEETNRVGGWMDWLAYACARGASRMGSSGPARQALQTARWRDGGRSKREMSPVAVCARFVLPMVGCSCCTRTHGAGPQKSSWIKLLSGGPPGRCLDGQSVPRC